MDKKRSKLKKLIQKYEEQLSYLFFGVLTTIVNYVSFAVLKYFWTDDWIHAVNIVTFIIATLFAYVTNKLFVFKSRSWSFKVFSREILSFFGSRIFSREILSFFGSRISSFILEEAGLFLCVDILNVGRYHLLFTDGTMIAKIVLSFVAVIINYFFSKLLVFNKSKEHTDTK